MDDTDSLIKQRRTKLAFGEFRERELVAFLCLLAAIHVFIFSAAFPFFTNIDEPAHFDLVVKYSHGHVPRSLEPVSADSAVYLALFSSCAYFGTPDKFPDGKMPPPPWSQPIEKMRRDLAVNAAGWSAQKNYESPQPPLYYALAGSWWRVGQWCGLRSGGLLYWLRFLNVLLVAVLVWLGYLAARMIFPDERFLRLGVPALLAFLPQSAFYSIENDVMSALCFGAAFLLLLKFLNSEKPGVRLGAAAGLALAATYLTKIVNVPLIAVSLLMLFLKIVNLMKAKQWRAAWPAFLTLGLCAGVPAGLWMTWCKFNYGDLTGSTVAIQYWNTIAKPLGEWWHHPIFTLRGSWTFLSDLLSKFWQGEFKWHDQPMTFQSVGIIYALLSIGFVLLALANVCLAPAGVTSLQRQTLWFGFGCLIASVVFWGGQSIIYDFTNCPNPTPQYPYFSTGRYLMGAVIPFLLLFVRGLDRALNRFGDAAKFSALAAMILFMLAGEIATDWPAFSNEFNWYHI